MNLNFDDDDDPKRTIISNKDVNLILSIDNKLPFYLLGCFLLLFYVLLDLKMSIVAASVAVLVGQTTGKTRIKFGIVHIQNYFVYFGQELAS